MPLIYKDGSTILDLQNMQSDELFDFIENIPDVSEDEIDENSDEDEAIVSPEQLIADDEATVASEEILDEYLKRNGVEELTIQVPDLEHNLDHEPSTSVAVSSIKPTSNKTASEASKPKELRWRRKHIQNVPCNFSGITELPSSIKELETPFQFFRFFFDDELVEKIIEETMKYCFSKHSGNPFNLSKNELFKYLGVCVMSSTCTHSNMRMYWNENVGMDIIRNSISQKSFEKIRSFFILMTI